MKREAHRYLPAGIPADALDNLPLRDCYFTQDGEKVAFVKFAGREVAFLYLSHWMEGGRFVLRVLLHETAKRGQLYAFTLAGNEQMAKILDKVGERAGTFYGTLHKADVPHLPELHQAGVMKFGGTAVYYNGLYLYSASDDPSLIERACRYFCCPYFVSLSREKGEFAVHQYLINPGKVRFWLKKLRG